MASTKMKRKRKAGNLVSRDRLRCVAWLLLGTLLILTGPGGSLAGAQKKGKEKTEAITDTLILVTTFSELGQTLRGARVRLYPADKDGNVVKGKAKDGRTNNMGEIPFRVPKTEARYVLVAEMKGFTRTEKVVHVVGEDQQDVFLQLPARP
jgi:hypothetical protein